jgi:hypothetical protein
LQNEPGRRGKQFAGNNKVGAQGWGAPTGQFRRSIGVCNSGFGGVPSRAAY